MLLEKVGCNFNIFKPHVGNVASGGGLDLVVSDIFDESKSEEYFEWLYFTSVRLPNVLVPYTREYRATTN